MIRDRDRLIELLGGGEAELVHGDLRYQLAVETQPLCSRNCPAGINVKGYVNLIANRLYGEALELIREVNPFPGICGRVCTHPCEANCQRSETGNSLSIKALKRFVADYEVSRKPAELKSYPKKYPERIAVIGSGPGGLTAAVDLTRLGYAVTVFEAMDIPGGMMQWGIPEFRLPRDVLRREITLIESMGVDLRTGTRIEDPTSLLSDGFGAVLLATGAWNGIPLRIQGEELEGVVDCLEFLRSVYAGETTKVQGRAIVIGGGDSALDAARTALRLGADHVKIAYRRTEREMPANPDEVREAEEEGVEIAYLSIPKSIFGKDRVEQIEFLRAELVEEDESGRRRPIPVQGSEFLEACDLIIPAISSTAENSKFEEHGIRFTERKLLQVENDFLSSVPGIFGLGDAVRGPSTIVEVIGDAHKCAASIHTHLRDQDDRELKDTAIPSAGRAGIVVKTTPFSTDPRHPIPILESETRGQCFGEVEGVYSELVARDEASRCNSCGPCTACPVCLPGCDSKQIMATMGNRKFLIKVPCDLSRMVYHGEATEWKLSSQGSQRDILLTSLTPVVNQELCFACGRCEPACTYRAVRIGLKADGKAYSYIEHDVCRSCGRCVLSCPSGAISLESYNDESFLEQLLATIKANNGIAVIGCQWSLPDPSLSGFDTVGLMCSVGVTPGLIIQAFALGARGVLVSYCSDSDQHYLDIDYGITEILEDTKSILEIAGMNPERIRSTSDRDILRALDKFKTDLDLDSLHGYHPITFDYVPGRIGRAIQQLSELSAQETGSPACPILLKGAMLKGAGMPHILEMVGNVEKLAQRLGMNTVEKSLCSLGIEPGNILNPEIKSFPAVLLDHFNRSDFSYRNIRVGIHGPCSPGNSAFTNWILELLRIIPGCDPVLLDPHGCGGSDWRFPDSYAREKAMNVYRDAEEKGVGIIIPTTTDCLTFLKACNRTGAWRHSSVEVTDFYSFIISTLKRDLKRGGYHE